MSNNGCKERIVISVGGSLVVPNGGIDNDFLSGFNTFIRNKLSDNTRQFFLIVGGGAIARHYQQAGREILGHDVAADDLDWLAIHATRLNAQLIRTIFKDVAHPFVLKHYEIIRKATESVVVAAGWKPGWSTDYDAVLLCEDYGAKTVINLSNIDMVYDKDPNKFEDAKAIDKISWADFRKIVGNEWSPGLNAPFDPVAAKKAQELGIKVVVLNGKNFENLEKYFKGEEFVGTVIE
ncbi:MAG: UMP kinase [Candidatus Levybacteria bacterium]|nr:UMP kinase [Candidatus Levybacteria bacterium]